MENPSPKPRRRKGKPYTNWPLRYKKDGYDDLRRSFLSNLEYNLSKDEFTYTLHDQFLSLAYTLRERLIEEWILTQQHYHRQNVKRVNYLSMEFLPGRLLHDTINNLNVGKPCTSLLRDLGLSFDDIIDQESDAGLGNGGLGRLAACFLDSLATLEYPAIGYGIRYEFGIFRQTIRNFCQQELPEEWLQNVNPWEIKRPEYRVRVQFFGKVNRTGSGLRQPSQWIDTDDVFAVPFDTPVPGYRNNTVNTLRLWSAHASTEFNLDYFNRGDYIGACHEKLVDENISKVLYPNDGTLAGKELRLKQEFFFSSASLQDIIRRFRADNGDWNAFPEKAAIHLNETHPAIAIPELMRLFIDIHHLDWDTAWSITARTFAYTNHTLMPEALEKWSVDLLRRLLPRHMEIIYEINRQFLDEVGSRFHEDDGMKSRMSIIEEGPEKYVRMAYLAVIGSYSVNGVAKLHSQLVKERLMPDFARYWPGKFNNKTNGITQRRWLNKANRPLSALISDSIGTEWIKNLEELRKLEPFAEDSEFQKKWTAVKLLNKRHCASFLLKTEGLTLDPDTIFDVQVKRIHEYKRQLLNILRCVSLYTDIRDGATDVEPLTVIFAGKAAPAYRAAKSIIELINRVAFTVNNDGRAGRLLKIHFIPNYRVSLAEYIIPASDISEQISTAGTEASGTGNMKFALNGAVTIGTMDGANIEIREEVGKENILIFGLTRKEVEEVKRRGYDPLKYYEKSTRLKNAVELIQSGFFCPEDPHRFDPIIQSLLYEGDTFMVCADFDSYCQCHRNLVSLYQDRNRWAGMSILNVARMGTFSSDRTIREYAEEIWKLKPVSIPA
ncbi:MAG: glycogen/starch/alpha-glucan phosphorylase [Chitinispirillaceae bacterium]|nr:glycogen/starch/alpha-glucan phosphorylase [Chitinispirillaceae bacterium]